ncbi:hypothetical protein Rs2_02939 [Raphanus sativus]|nr:hypothetical protein Rs2_02939 [Raphanus sativus]
MLLDAGKAFGFWRWDNSSVSSARSLFVFTLLSVFFTWMCVYAFTSTQVDAVDTTPLTVIPSCAPLFIVLPHSPIVATASHGLLVIASLCTIKNNIRSTKSECGFSGSSLFNVYFAPPPPPRCLFHHVAASQIPSPSGRCSKGPNSPLLWSRHSLQARRHHIAVPTSYGPRRLHLMNLLPQTVASLSQLLLPDPSTPISGVLHQ